MYTVFGSHDMMANLKEKNAHGILTVHTGEAPGGTTRKKN